MLRVVSNSPQLSLSPWQLLRCTLRATAKSVEFSLAYIYVESAPYFAQQLIRLLARAAAEPAAYACPQCIGVKHRIEFALIGVFKCSHERYLKYLIYYFAKIFVK